MKQAPGERNFHIFYQLLESGDAALLQRLHLEPDVKKYTYLAAVSLHEKVTLPVSYPAVIESLLLFCKL